MKLDDIAQKYNTDKSSLWHNYTEKYEQYFSVLREQKIKILEIGIQNGYSLQTWRDYFPHAHIYGLDIVDCSAMNEDRVTTLQGSQNDLSFLKRINDAHGPFDIIIDDGSHNSNDMKISFDFLFPLLRSGGIYVIEDIHCVYWPELSDGGTALMDRLKELMDTVNASGKCSLAEPKNIEKDYAYRIHKIGKMNWWEESVEYLHLYRSIAFIKKYETAPPYTPPIIKLSLKVLTKRFIGKVYGRLIHKRNRLRESLSLLTKSISRKKAPNREELAEYRKKIKIYDIFTYNGEIEILDIRLHMLYDRVDQFIIVEAPTTFSGKAKPLYFESHKKRFSKFMDKITYFVIDDYPADSALCELADTSSNVPFGGPEHWRREFYQKESIKKALIGLNDNDFCFIGDVDEIWNPEVVVDYTSDEIFRFRQKMYMYHLNYRTDEPWIGTIATKYKNVRTNCLNHLRTRGKTIYDYLDSGGWHFTNMGGIEEVRRKLDDSYTDESYNTRDVQNNLEKRFGATDHLGRNFRYWIDEDTLPAYLRKNRGKYATLFK